MGKFQINVDRLGHIQQLKGQHHMVFFHTLKFYVEILKNLFIF